MLVTIAVLLTAIGAVWLSYWIKVNDGVHGTERTDGVFAWKAPPGAKERTTEEEPDSGPETKRAGGFFQAKTAKQVAAPAPDEASEPAPSHESGAVEDDKPRKAYHRGRSEKPLYVRKPRR